jgi:uncharacterized repeat protein (TIGR02543 family)
VQLTATPGPGWVFVNWSGDANGTANPLNVTMDKDRTITATFADVQSPSVQVTVPERWREHPGRRGHQDHVPRDGQRRGHQARHLRDP